MHAAGFRTAIRHVTACHRVGAEAHAVAERKIDAHYDAHYLQTCGTDSISGARCQTCGAELPAATTAWDHPKSPENLIELASAGTPRTTAGSVARPRVVPVYGQQRSVPDGRGDLGAPGRLSDRSRQRR